jgi:ATP-dependent Clp protease adaptor protein ClpS
MSETLTDADVVVTTSRPAAETRPRRQPNYAVVVYNDDFHTFEYVIDGLSRVCGHSRNRALELAVQIHLLGQAPVWHGSLELAELKRDQIRGLGTDFHASKPVTFPLAVTVEPLA